MTKSSVCLIVTCLLATPVGWAVARNPDKPARHGKDQVQRMEEKALRAAFSMREWRLADTNDDLQVEPKELAAVMPSILTEAKKTAQQVLKRFDADGDGHLNAYEQAQFAAMVDLVTRARKLRFLDTNGDFRITAEEEALARERIKEQVDRLNERIMEELDTNHDGVISPQERQANPRPFVRRKRRPER